MATTDFINGTLIEHTWLNDVDAHAYDQNAVAHTAAHIPIVDVGNLITATDVEGALQELATGGAVTAANVSIADVGNYYTGTNVEAALAELGVFFPTSDLVAVTLTAGTNVSSVATAGLFYTKIGSIVTFSAYLEQITVTTANVLSTVYVSLPFASNFTTVDLAIGTATALDSATYSATGVVKSDTVGKRIQVDFLPNNNGILSQLYITGHYFIL